ncbi:hypothetical protein D3C85_1217950 [compost metagenome]
MPCGFETLLEVAKNTHDVTSLDTWSRRRISQFDAGMQPENRMLYTPQNTCKVATDDPHAGVPALPFLDGLGLRIVRNRGGQGRLYMKFAMTVRLVRREPAQDAGCGR